MKFKYITRAGRIFPFAGDGISAYDFDIMRPQPYTVTVGGFKVQGIGASLDGNIIGQIYTFKMRQPAFIDIVKRGDGKGLFGLFGLIIVVPCKQTNGIVALIKRCCKCITAAEGFSVHKHGKFRGISAHCLCTESNAVGIHCAVAEVGDYGKGAYRYVSYREFKESIPRGEFYHVLALGESYGEAVLA